MVDGTRVWAETIDRRVRWVRVGLTGWGIREGCDEDGERGREGGVRKEGAHIWSEQEV